MKSEITYPRIFFIACLGGFVTVFGFGVAQPFLPLYAQSLGASDMLVGWVVSFYFITRLFIELPSGIISDRIGRRGPLLAGLFLSFLGALLCSLAHDPVFLISGRAVWGAGTALFSAPQQPSSSISLKPSSEVRRWAHFRALSSSEAS